MAAEIRANGAAGAIRMDGDGEEPRRIVGVASVFYDGTPRTEYQLWSDVYERVASTAFDRALREDDVRALFNHDSNELLGRFRAGNADASTLRLWKEADGLHYSIEPSDGPVYAKVRDMLERGDLDGSSFQFFVRSEEITRDTERGLIIRTITDVELLDVGPVTFPAYSATSSGVRSGDKRAEHEAERIRAALEIQEAEMRSRVDLSVYHARAALWGLEA